MPLTPQEVVDFASERLGSVNARLITKSDKEYVDAEHVDFSVGDVLIRAFMNNRITESTSIPQSDLSADRQTQLDKYVEPMLKRFFNKARTVLSAKSHIISVPPFVVLEKGQSVYRSNKGGVHVMLVIGPRAGGGRDIIIQTLCATTSL